MGMDPNNFKEIQDSVQNALVSTTRSAGQIANEDLAFQCASNPAVVPLLERQKSRLLGLVNVLTKAAAQGTDVAAPNVSTAEALEDKWTSLVDVFDNLLEKADACLDEYTGVIKRSSPSQQEKPGNAGNVVLQSRLSRQQLEKPQLLFVNAPSNHDTSPFKPLLTLKPHAIKPLEESLQLAESENGLRYEHPYKTEIQSAQIPQTVSMKRDPIPYLPFESTNATFVDTPEAVDAMLRELKKAKEIAVDLEHHDEHSYIGIVCLMQISTREKDWVIDTLKPWRQDLQKLNEVFADPNIVKVLHGSAMDIIWLQRDLGLYIVGLFDTFHASSALHYPKRGLAFLLKKFVDFDAAKKYQMADWRVRPLPEGMFNYARSDTHFLLYIFDMVRNGLIDCSDLEQPDGDLVEFVMQRSKQESLQSYERPLYDDKDGLGMGGWHSMLYKNPNIFDREQFAVFRDVHQWRDKIARIEDESPSAILTRNSIFNIAREIPLDIPSLLLCCHPLSNELRKHKNDLATRVKEAKANSAKGPEMKDIFGKGPLHVERKVVGSKPPAHNVGVARVLADIKSQAPLPLRAQTSDFWGSAIRNRDYGFSGSMKVKRDDLKFVLPLPNLTAEIFVDTKPQHSPPTAEVSGPGSRAEHQYIKERKPKANEVFVMMDSRKRKASEAEAESHTSNGPVNNEIAAAPETMNLDVADAVDNEQAERKRVKRMRKMEKKRLKQESKSGGGRMSSGQPQTELQPFDYENAPSVLNAKPTKEERAKSRAKAADPYKKSLNAPIGLPRAQRQVPGKSSTFTE